ncbi:MAG TPA: hypothetical protein VK427_18855 [Kofleriaceae bacterium]|nr:hypothetical protein [Kofleriaceae bacterium]
MADVAEAKVSEIFYSNVQDILNTHSAGLEDMVNDYILPRVGQAVALKDALMNTPLPGVNKSFTQLSTDMGATIQLHTVTPDGGVAASAVLRMSGAPGAGKIKGVLRMPKQVCKVAIMRGGPLKGATIPLGLETANADLAAKTGQPCSTLSASAPLAARTFLGASPRSALGPAAQDLPLWKSNAGQPKWTGTLTQTNKWYECGFEIANLPNTAIVSIDSQPWLLEHNIELKDQRFFASAQIVLDHLMKPVAGSSIVFGGEGKCPGATGGGGMEQNTLDKIRDALDVEKCPQCGVKQRPGSKHIFEITNPQAFLDTAAGKELLETVRANRAAPGFGAKARVTGKPPVTKPGRGRNR